VVPLLIYGRAEGIPGSMSRPLKSEVTRLVSAMSGALSWAGVCNYLYKPMMPSNKGVVEKAQLGDRSPFPKAVMRSE
jgi:hypothetical protein